MKKFYVVCFIVLVFLLAGCAGSREVKDMSFTASVGGESVDGTYSGTVKKNIPKGNGIFVARNSHGDKFTYEGEWKNGLFDGEGKLFSDDPGYNIQEGNFSKGEFNPTPYQFFKALGTRKGNQYEITPAAEKYLEKYPDVFLENSARSSDISEKFNYKAFRSNPKKFGDSLIRVSSVRVNQLVSVPLWGKDHTFCIASDMDGENKFFISMFGKTEPLSEGAVISFTALPMAFFTYESTTGKKVEAVACAGVSIEPENIAVQNLLWDFYAEF